ncbi:hypothetical protein ATCC51561_1409 [Campylobacter concisus ATCC 51561]|nr:hypothetical protein ATCC51561_1409 [Campylobacter concisus ATCC 51561]
MALKRFDLAFGEFSGKFIWFWLKEILDANLAYLVALKSNL